MRRNKKLLIASVAAMGALALSVGATSTFAWFQVNNTASVTVNKTATAGGKISVTSTPVNLGGFTFTPVLSNVSETVALTDTSGNTYVYLTGDTANEIPATAGTKYGSGIVNLKVSYSGELTNVAEINAAYQAVVSSLKVILSGSSSVTGSGIRYFAAAPTSSWAGAATLNVTTGFTKNDLDDLAWSSSKSETPTTSITTPNFYFCLTGVDGTVQTTNDTYTITATSATVS